MALRLVAITLRQVLRPVLLACLSSRSKDIEILVLRHEVGLPPDPRRAPEGRDRHFGDLDTGDPCGRARQARPEARHLAPVPPCPGLLDRRLRSLHRGDDQIEDTARDLSSSTCIRDEPIEFLIHDRDYRFGPIFDEIFKAEEIEMIRTPWRAPKANAYAERLDQIPIGPMQLRSTSDPRSRATALGLPRSSLIHVASDHHPRKVRVTGHL